MRDGSTTIGYLNHLASFDHPEQLAGALSEFSHTHRCHVLHVAHLPHLGKAKSKVSAVQAIVWGDLMENPKGFAVNPIAITIIDV